MNKKLSFKNLKTILVSGMTTISMFCTAFTIFSMNLDLLLPQQLLLGGLATAFCYFISTVVAEIFLESSYGEKLVFNKEELILLQSFKDALSNGGVKIKNLGKNLLDFSLVFNSSDQTIGIDTFYVSDELIEKTTKFLVMNSDQTLSPNEPVKNSLPLFLKKIRYEINEKEKIKKDQRNTEIKFNLVQNLSVYKNTTYYSSPRENFIHSVNIILNSKLYDIKKIDIRTALDFDNFELTLQLKGHKLVFIKQGGWYSMEPNKPFEQLPSFIQEDLPSNYSIQSFYKDHLDCFFPQYQENVILEEVKKQHEQMDQEFQQDSLKDNSKKYIKE